VLGFAGGIVLFLVLLVVAWPLTQGPGRGFTIVLTCSLLGGAITYLLRRAHLR
jgi:hypothetical protein